MPLEGGESDRLRITALLFGLGKLLLFPLSELRGREDRVAENLADQGQHGRKVLACRLDRDVDLRRSPGYVHPSLQAVDLVFELLPRVLARAAHEHVGRGYTGRGAIHEALLVP